MTTTQAVKDIKKINIDIEKIIRETKRRLLVLECVKGEASIAAGNFITGKSSKDIMKSLRAGNF